jgi:hypothetical protein
MVTYVNLFGKSRSLGTTRNLLQSQHWLPQHGNRSSYLIF